MSGTVRVATRGSRLAMAQTGQIVERLRQAHPGIAFEIVSFKTTGDKVTDRPLSSFRGTGVFVKELQKALLGGEADFAVHSLKDVPTAQAEGLILSSFPAREDPQDVMITREGGPLESLPPGALVGTGSPRRQVQLRRLRTDLRFCDLRGNLDTRLEKLRRGDCGAIVLAAAGLKRLGVTIPNAHPLPLSQCIPAVGQGILALECRRDDVATRDLLACIDDEATRTAALAERSFLAALGGGCLMPFAAHAIVEEGGLRMIAMVADPGTGRMVVQENIFPLARRREAGEDMAAIMLALCKEQSISIR